ncbi:MAG TPA: Clp protease N-terminal domain-containing protein, partial [Chitinivibrionales bacterium]|nr:Clp protease N-terminal domain-containing protein [Chitinivibrionales bacterium]
MNAEKFTSKSQEALEGANKIAVEMNHQELLPLHLMLALVMQQGGLVQSILQKLNIDVKDIAEAVIDRLRKIPAVTGSGATQTYMSRGLTQVISEAEKTASRMKDEFVSVEHLLLALLEKDSECREAGERFRISHAKVMETLKAVRGNQRVTSPEPEATFNALEKYSRNLTDMAHKGKLDPVIGRDEEIRRVIQ